MEQIYFEEKQKYNQFAIKLIIVIGATIPVSVFSYGYVQQVFFDVQFGEPPVTNFALLLSVLLSLMFAIVLIGLFFGSNLKTIVRNGGIEIKYFPFHLKYKTILLSDIAEYKIRKYSPLLEYGGWGIRWGFSPRGMAYNVHGNMGIQLILKDGSKVLIGTQKPEEFFNALNKMNNQ